MLSSTDFAADMKRHFSHVGPAPSLVLDMLTAKIKVTRNNGRVDLSYNFVTPQYTWSSSFIPAEEPNNFVYTYLSKRKVTAFDRMVDLHRTRVVAPNLGFLTSKVDRLTEAGYVGAQEYDQLCQQVLGFRIGTYASEGGYQAGISVGRYDHIPIEAMGEGVSNQLGLITDLCMADGNLFLIEELENDVHPESLKALLDVIVQKSANNQFIITTHSNIVVRHLGAAPNSRIFTVESNFAPNAVPTSTIHPVDNTAEGRIAVLRQLGYELYDFDLWEGWLILEESSAEIIIRRYLIPWFAPRLAAVRTLAAGGTSKVEPTFEDFRRLFLFAHLEPQYSGRAWVIVDVDASGKTVVKGLRSKYSSWRADRFRTLTEANFERYYPPRFKDQIDAALALKGSAKQQAKKAVLDEVKAWCVSEPEMAKKEFEVSAAEVIAILREVDGQLF